MRSTTAALPPASSASAGAALAWRGRVGGDAFSLGGVMDWLARRIGR
jgi:hypothetical protein